MLTASNQTALLSEILARAQSIINPVDKEAAEEFLESQTFIDDFDLDMLNDLDGDEEKRPAPRKRKNT